MIFEHLSDDIPPQMTNWNMVIPILMYFFNIYTSKPGICLKNISCMSDVDQSKATLLMTSGFRQYIEEYTVANF